MTSIEMINMARNIERVTNYNLGVDDIETTAEKMKHTLLSLEFTKFFPGEDDKDYLRVKAEFPAMAADVLVTLLTMTRRHGIDLEDVFDEFNRAIKK